MKRSIENLRQEYGNTPLLESELVPNPIAQFKQWLGEAIRAKVLEPNGCILATLTPLGAPAGRTVLLKRVSPQGFTFFTNTASRKGEQLQQHPVAALTFWWKEVYRQVCIEGSIKKCKRSEVLEYFSKRPRGAQLAALASEQSAPLATRLELDTRFAALKKKYAGKKVPCPATWGGYTLIPERMEFWQGRANRLHDRFLYVKADGDWVISRLYP